MADTVTKFIEMKQPPELKIGEEERKHIEGESCTVAETISPEAMPEKGTIEHSSEAGPGKEEITCKMSDTKTGEIKQEERNHIEGESCMVPKKMYLEAVPEDVIDSVEGSTKNDSFEELNPLSEHFEEGKEFTPSTSLEELDEDTRNEKMFPVTTFLGSEAVLEVIRQNEQTEATTPLIEQLEEGGEFVLAETDGETDQDEEFKECKEFPTCTVEPSTSDSYFSPDVKLSAPDLDFPSDVKGDKDKERAYLKQKEREIQLIKELYLTVAENVNYVKEIIQAENASRGLGKRDVQVDSVVELDKDVRDVADKKESVLGSGCKIWGCFK